MENKYPSILGTEYEYLNSFPKIEELSEHEVKANIENRFIEELGNKIGELSKPRVNDLLNFARLKFGENLFHANPSILALALIINDSGISRPEDVVELYMKFIDISNKWFKKEVKKKKEEDEENIDKERIYDVIRYIRKLNL